MFSFSFIGAPRLIEFIGWISGSTSVSLTGIQAGDIGVAFNRAGTSGSYPSAVVPAGWTTVAITDIQWDGGGAQNFFNRQIIARRLLDGSETTYTGMNGDREQLVIAHFRPNWSVSSLAVESLHAQATGGTPAAQNVTAGSGAIPLIVLGAAGGNSTAAVNSTPAFASTDSFQVIDRLEAGHQIYNQTPVDHSVSMANAGAANILQSFYLRVS